MGVQASKPQPKSHHNHNHNTVADWMSVASGDLDKINSLEDHSISSVSECNIHREIN